MHAIHQPDGLHLQNNIQIVEIATGNRQRPWRGLKNLCTIVGVALAASRRHVYDNDPGTLHAFGPERCLTYRHGARSRPPFRCVAAGARRSVHDRRGLARAARPRRGLPSGAAAGCGGVRALDRGGRAGSSRSAPSTACRWWRSAPAPRSKAMSPRSAGGVSIDLDADEPGRWRCNAEDLDCHRPGRRHPQAAQRAPARHRPVLPDRPRRRRHPRRHGGDARLGHQRRPLRHDAGERAGADGGPGRRAGSSAPAAGRASRRPATISPACSWAPRGRSASSPRSRSGCYGVPEAISAAVCSFPAVDDAVEAVIRPSRPASRSRASSCSTSCRCAAASATRKLEGYRVAPTLFFEFHGSRGRGAEQAEQALAIAAELRRPGLPVGDPARGAQPAVAGAARRLLCGPGAAAGLRRLGHRRLRADLAPRRMHRARRARTSPRRACWRRSSAMSATAISICLILLDPDRPEEIATRRGAQQAAGPARHRHGRHLHRRARRRPRQDRQPGRGGRRGGRGDARDQARARSRRTSSTRARSSGSEPATSPAAPAIASCSSAWRRASTSRSSA